MGPPLGFSQTRSDALDLGKDRASESLVGARVNRARADTTSASPGHAQNRHGPPDSASPGRSALQTHRGDRSALTSRLSRSASRAATAAGRADNAASTWDNSVLKLVEGLLDEATFFLVVATSWV